MINPSDNVYYIPEPTREEKAKWHKIDLEQRQKIYDSFPTEVQEILDVLLFRSGQAYKKYRYEFGLIPAYVKTIDGKVRADFIEEKPLTDIFDNMFQFKKSTKKITLDGYKKVWAFKKEDLK